MAAIRTFYTHRVWAGGHRLLARLSIAALKQGDHVAFKKAIELDIGEGLQMLSENIKRKHNGLDALH